MDLQSTSAIPDSRGINLYRSDRDAAALLAHSLPAALFCHLEPHFDRLGALAAAADLAAAGR